MPGVTVEPIGRSKKELHRFFDVADSYGSHPHAAEALKHLPREKVTVLTKSWARDAGGMRADIDRFRKELNVEYIDILLMHCLTDADPPTVLGVLRDMHNSGKAVIGMKILGQGDMRDRVDEALKHALSIGVLSAFTIGAESRDEQDDLVRRIASVSVA